MDIMEANKLAFQVTPHKCDPPQNGHYYNCEGSGPGQNTKHMANKYGPGSNYEINSEMPFTVETTFVTLNAQLSKIVTNLTQDHNLVSIVHDQTNSGDGYSLLKCL
jgi:hypothetical protein